MFPKTPRIPINLRALAGRAIELPSEAILTQEMAKIFSGKPPKK